MSYTYMSKELQSNQISKSYLHKMVHWYKKFSTHINTFVYIYNRETCQTDTTNTCTNVVLFKTSFKFLEDFIKVKKMWKKFFKKLIYWHIDLIYTKYINRVYSEAGHYDKKVLKMLHTFLWKYIGGRDLSPN